MEDSFWLINSNRSRSKKIRKEYRQNKDKFFEYFFVDSVENLLGVLGKEPPVMTKEKS